MLSRENAVILGCIGLSVVALFGLGRLVADPPLWLGAAIIIGIGVVLPTLTNQYLDRRDATEGA